MSDRSVLGECENCESTFEIAFTEELVSDNSPSFCPFCGDPIESIQEQYIDEDELDGNEEWE